MLQSVRRSMSFSYLRIAQVRGMDGSELCRAQTQVLNEAQVCVPHHHQH